jgi:hypothetical protein
MNIQTIKIVFSLILHFLVCFSIVLFLAGLLGLLIIEHNQDFITGLFSICGCCFLIVYVTYYIFGNWFKNKNAIR